MEPPIPSTYTKIGIMIGIIKIGLFWPKYQPETSLEIPLLHFGHTGLV